MPEIFKKGQFIYPFASSAVLLQTNTKKCCADFVGPLVINRVLDETHYIPSDLQCHILCGVYHARRLKKAQLRTPIGNVTTYDELKTTFQESNTDTDNTLHNISTAALVQSLVALNCYKCSPVQNCTCVTYENIQGQKPNKKTLVLFQIHEICQSQPCLFCNGLISINMI